MDEIAAGLFDWSTFHEGIGQAVHSHFHAPSGTLLDPRVPDGGLDAVRALGRPERVVLTNRHHARHAPAFVEAFGCAVVAHPAALAELAGQGVEARAAAPGNRVAPGVELVEVGAITPEEVGVRLDAGAGWLALADVVHPDGPEGFAFFPDELLGDDPAEVKRDMVAALARVVEAGDFAGLLFAHGPPMPDGRERLAAWVREWTPTS